jgi:uncharacterized membrane protein YqaE (UPF0057 family)
MKIVKLILCFFFPPVSVALQVGPTLHLWINIALCFLLWIPAVVHAFWIVLTDKKGA